MNSTMQRIEKALANEDMRAGAVAKKLGHKNQANLQREMGRMVDMGILLVVRTEPTVTGGPPAFVYGSAKRHHRKCPVQELLQQPWGVQACS